MSRWKRLSSERLIATTLVLLATSIGSMAGCDNATPIDNKGGAGGAGGSGGSGGSACMPQDDNNDCTTDACSTDGVPTHTPVTVGTACKTAGGSLCDDTGTCVECIMATDCPGTDDACQTRTCTMGVCAFDFTAIDTPVPTQTTGDCKITVCDGAGAQVDNNDDTDVPDDQNACTSDVCTAGLPSNPNLTQGTDCTPPGGPTPLVCNDLGQCVGCNTAADCPGTDDECSTRTCAVGVCIVSYTAKDTPVAAQTDNNCLKHVCDGTGAFVDIADDTDLPLDDGNACTGETCSMGMPNHPNLANGTMCNDGDLCTPMDTCQMGMCKAGTAITCTASDQCHVAGVCDSMTGMCSNPTATNGTACNDGNLCTQTDACSAGTCAGTNPVVCSASDQCHVAGTCNAMTGMCSNPAATDGTTCNDGNLCTQTDACLAGTCSGANPVVCSASDQCHVAGTCNTATGMCSNPAATDGTTCNDGNPCTQTDSCSAGSCAGSNPVVCSASDQCHVGGTCNAMTGTCSNPVAADGTTCTSNMKAGACTMGTCVACGDGIINGAETCDDGAQNGQYGKCNALCNGLGPSCGDGILNGPEICDDKNTTSGDGCSSACQLDITCGAGEVSVIVTNSTATPIADTYTGVISSLNIAQTGVVRKVISTINVAHANTGQLDIFLAPPYGAQRVLVNDVGTGANFTATTFSDAAATAITTAALLPPYTGTYKPVETLSDAAGFANQTATGNWVLRLSDDTTGTAGTLNSWSLALCIDPTVSSVCGNGIVEPTEQCDDANAVTGDGCNACQLEFTCAANEVRVIQKSNSAALLIPDNTPAGVTSTIAIGSMGITSKAIAVLNAISHQWDGDVSVSLTAPTGTTLDLTSGNGSSGDNYLSTLLSDAGATTIDLGTPPFRGRYRPEAAFTGLVGSATNGNWTLKIADTATSDAGLFHSWTLGLCIAPLPVCGNGIVELGEACDDGGTTSGNGCSSLCTVEAGYTCTGSPSMCTSNCGNGTIQAGEACDDGNTASNDGCSSVCAIEANYGCSGIPSMCMKHETNCSDGIDNDGDGTTDSLDSDCTLPAYFPGCAAGQTLRVYKSYDTPLAVPDNLPAGVTSSVYVVDNIGVIASAATLLNLTHTFDADLDISLTSPANVTFDMSSDNGSTGDNYTNTILASGCAIVTNGIAPFSACYAPEDPLFTSLTGTPAQGVWKLKTVDDLGTDTGTLDNWTLVLCIAP